MKDDKNQIERIKDGETGPGDAKRSQPKGQKPVTAPKSTVRLTTLPSSADTGRGKKDRGER